MASASTRDRILTAARRLAQLKPIHDISLTDVAKEAEVSWPTVRRYLGTKQQLRDFLTLDAAPTAQPIDTRDRILVSAQRVFAHHGYAGATLDAIAADAGLTKGAVYWHFASKVELFLALLRNHQDTPLTVTAAQIQDLMTNLGPAEAVKTLIQQQIQYASDHPDWCRLSMEFYIQSRQSEVQQALQELNYQSQEQAIATLMRQLQDQGGLNANVDPEVFATLWSALVNGLILLYIVDPQANNPAPVASQIAQLLWQGLQPTSSPPVNRSEDEPTAD
jgi:AcrR family transcriptional regulator